MPACVSIVPFREAVGHDKNILKLQTVELDLQYYFYLSIVCFEILEMFYHLLVL
jgi:hypothetical protein